MKSKIIASLFVTAPALAFAQDGGIQETVNIFGAVVKALVPIAFGLAIATFFFGLAMVLFGEGTGKDKGKSIMFWGVIAVFIMTSLMGIVQFIGNSVGIDNAGKENNLNVPTIKQQ